ncbi:NAD-glutamate dehydrogenase [Demetria terragena]|uniref:NAD-glutamate dehydrogenase n=1 Tax=Demetria terragena TaxID=63959 RepID=UPI00035CD3CB|nr:NAD-glutamate dehydrogenase [Demetria terragena]
MTLAQSQSQSESRTELLKAAAKHAPPGSDGDDLCTEFYRGLESAELADYGSDHLAGIFRSHLQLAQKRLPGESTVRVFRPNLDRDGWVAPYAVLQIVTDDMPFLVDSVTAALSREDRDVHLLLHPQMSVRRDADGALQEVTPASGRAGVGTVESWMHLEIDLANDEDSDRSLEATLRKVLSDVRAAVEDWEEMRDACTNLVKVLGADPPLGIPESIVERTRGFLRWLADDHFTFLGYKEYELDTVDGEDVLRSVPASGLGVLRGDDGESRSFRRLTGEVRSQAREPQLLILTKANSRATVHRGTYFDYIGVKTFDVNGNVVGERRFLGLYTSTAYTDSVRRVPVVRERIEKVLQRSGFHPSSHSGKDLLTVLENYPRDELLQTGSDELYDISTKVLRLTERRQSQLFLRKDDYGRYMSAMFYLPRDRYNTAVRLRMEGILREEFNADSVDFTTSVDESVLARIHFVVRVKPGESLPEVEPQALQARLVDATRTWGERLSAQAEVEDGSIAAARVASLYSRAFPESYKEDFSARQAVADLRRLEALEGPLDTEFTLYREPGADPHVRRFKLFRRSPVMLTSVMPIFTDLGVGVTDERPYEMDRADGETVYIYDFGLRADDPDVWGTGEDEIAAVREVFQDAFAEVWDGRAESDGFNALVLRAGMRAREVTALRAIAHYLRQAGSTFSLNYMIEATLANINLARAVIELVDARFDPELNLDMEAREAAEQEVLGRIEAGLENVASLDHDRIIRSFVGVVRAVLRTNGFQRDEQGRPRDVLSFKIDCAKVPGLPSPKPMFEIWVYSPRVEGVHLRFGKVARGGLRWSDRREDFRTEVLGLVKAQMVKNAVIVPTGSKGGFVAKQLPDPADREAWLNEGIAAYKAFIAGMLDLTDNLVDGAVVPPAQVVRHDPDDTYLVVAADKGTAAFSDIANGVAQSYGFWLDDAFASGGSAGYDHKEMGITARGAWESVKRHFRDMGVDCQTEDFTAAGVGDMSGDVFGNGMLLSEHIRLVGAFDHRHIFIDPTPDAATTFVERQRLFELPRSSWADYDTSLISTGGGIWPRSAKSIPVSAQMRQALGLDDGVTSMTPNELMQAVLLAPVDLFWNGGIGTYIKSKSESHHEIGDRANDAIRVDGNSLRCKVIGEGGNLGASQLGRIEAAMAGVRVNTDAIDNSAGVDSSDHEVNIKILLTEQMRSGALTLEERNTLLASMTDEVGSRVLRDNYRQNTLLGNARAQHGSMATVHQRLIRSLEERGELNRALEFLPTDAELDEREAAGEGLTSPELSVLLSYAKLALKADLSESEFTSDTWFDQTLVEYFPEPLQERYRDAILEHPLRDQIIINSVVNSVVNRGGMTFAFRVGEETGADAVQVVRAFVVAREVFGLADFIRQVDALDNTVPTSVQTTLYLEFRRLIDRATRWLLHSRPSHLDVGREIERFQGEVQRLSSAVPGLLRGAERQRWEASVAGLVEKGVPQDLAEQTAALLDTFSLLDIVELSQSRELDADRIAEVYYALSERLGIDRFLVAVAQLPREDRWDALARGAVRDDLYSVLNSLTSTVLDATDSDLSALERVEQWALDNETATTRGTQALAGILDLEQPTLASLSVALRTLRSVIRSGSAS